MFSKTTIYVTIFAALTLASCKGRDSYSSMSQTKTADLAGTYRPETAVQTATRSGDVQEEPLTYSDIQIDASANAQSTDPKTATAVVRRRSMKTDGSDLDSTDLGVVAKAKGQAFNMHTSANINPDSLSATGLADGTDVRMVPSGKDLVVSFKQNGTMVSQRWIRVSDKDAKDQLARVQQNVALFAVQKKAFLDAYQGKTLYLRQETITRLKTPQQPPSPGVSALAVPQLDEDGNPIAQTQVPVVQARPGTQAVNRPATLTKPTPTTAPAPQEPVTSIRDGYQMKEFDSPTEDQTSNSLNFVQITFVDDQTAKIDSEQDPAPDAPKMVALNSSVLFGLVSTQKGNKDKTYGLTVKLLADVSSLQTANTNVKFFHLGFRAWIALQDGSTDVSLSSMEKNKKGIPRRVIRQYQLTAPQAGLPKTTPGLVIPKAPAAATPDAPANGQAAPAPTPAPTPATNQNQPADQDDASANQQQAPAQDSQDNLDL